MTTTGAILDDRLADLREDTPGSVRATVDHLLGAAWDAQAPRRYGGRFHAPSSPFLARTPPNAR